MAAAVIALSGTYGQILSYVVSVDFLFFGLTGAALFVFRRRDSDRPVSFRAPLHPVTTTLFVAACWPSNTTSGPGLVGDALAQ